MFTGIIEEVGIVVALDLSSPSDGLVIRAHEVIEDMRPGDSIAVNGTCLTATSVSADSFAVGVMPETLRRTNLGDLVPGASVNLERPLQPTSRLGGHFVQGHVDGTGIVTSVTRDGISLEVRVESSADILRFVVEKGFITVDGASLTVTGVDADSFGIALIPYSQEHLASNVQTVGARVNLEVDILSKYVEKLLVH